MTFTKQLLSGSTNGKQILLTGATNGTAVTIHTAVSGTASLDEVYLYVYNDDTASHLVTILWGGTTEPDNAIRLTISSRQGRVMIADGMLIQNGLVIKAYADLANKVTIDGFVNNIA